MKRKSFFNKPRTPLAVDAVSNRLWHEQKRARHTCSIDLSLASASSPSATRTRRQFPSQEKFKSYIRLQATKSTLSLLFFVKSRLQAACRSASIRRDAVGVHIKLKRTCKKLQSSPKYCQTHPNLVLHSRAQVLEHCHSRLIALAHHSLQMTSVVRVLTHGNLLAGDLFVTLFDNRGDLHFFVRFLPI